MRVKKIFREILLSLHFAARRCVMMRHAKWCTVGAKMKRDYVFLDRRKVLIEMDQTKNGEMSHLPFNEQRKLARTLRILYTFSLPAQHILSRSSIFNAQAHVST